MTSSDQQLSRAWRAVGVIFATTHVLMANPAVVELMLDHHDALCTFISLARQVTPAELVTAAGFSRRPHGMILHTMKDLIETAQVGGRDLTAQLLDMGFIDVLVDCIKSVPEVGCQNCNGVVNTWGYLWTLIILSGEKMQEIEGKVREQRNAIRYMIDNNIIFAHAHGIESSTFSCVLAANLFGKDEENSFGCARHADANVAVDHVLHLQPVALCTSEIE